MNVVSASGFDNRGLIVAYLSAARLHGAATEAGDYKAANKSAELIATLYSEIRQRGLETQRMLLPLTEDPLPSVRLWSASHALEFCPERGEPVLAQLAASASLLGLSANVTLTEWRAGRLRFP